MKSRSSLIVIIILFTLLISFAVYNYLISIYEVTYKVEPENLYADNISEATITAVPLNAFGWHALFRDAATDFKISEGELLVEIIKRDESSGIIVLRAKNKPGVVKITAKSKYSLLPSPINIKIYPNIVEVKHEVNEII